MASEEKTPPKTPTPQSIPLQDLSRPPDAATSSSRSQIERGGDLRSTRSSEQKSIFGHARLGSRYERIAESSPTRPESLQPVINAGLSASQPGINYETTLPSDEVGVFAAATGSLGLIFGRGRSTTLPSTPPKQILRPPTITTSSHDDYRMGGIEGDATFSPDDSDTTPLANETYLQPTVRRTPSASGGQRHDRHKRNSVSWVDGEGSTRSARSAQSTSRLGDDLPNVSTAIGLHRKPSSNSSNSRLASASGEADGGGRSRSISPSPGTAIARANSMLRMMSQRVVNLSNDSEMVEQSMRRKSSLRVTRPSFDVSRKDTTEDSFGPDVEGSPHPSIAEEKRPSFTQMRQQSPISISPRYPQFQPNPLRGKSWGIFGPENKLRLFLREVLVHPATEPVILLLIVVQTVLLAVDSAPSVYNDPRSKNWGTGIDYALFVLFIIYTLELIARTIVSGFISNPIEYSTLDRSVGFKKAIYAQASNLFSLQRKESHATTPSSATSFQPSIVRTLTGTFPDPDVPGHGRQQQRIRLARRAFLRHSFNRLDFVAVVAYWISFGMMVGKFETGRHVYVFDMLSCLRILRLLGLTNGTSIILRSLKKAAPSLVNVAFLIGFFWLLFGIVGVQSFKASLRRTCTWVGPPEVGNYTQNIAPENVQFCGGHLDSVTGLPMPWITADGQNGTNTHKGFLCPQNSFCVQGGNPYNGTVSFDNIAQSLELVFVGISSNTFTDLMYYLMNSEYLAAALFFAAIIVVMTFWLINLLIAVITSSLQVIREESKQSAFTAQEIHQPTLDDGPKRNRLKKIYDYTYWFWIANIVAALLVQCLRSAHQSPRRNEIILNSETIVTFVLLAEIILRIAVDHRHFFQSRRNCFDLGIAVITSVTQIPVIRNSGQVYAWLTFFQIARIYRVVMAFAVTRDLIMVVFSNIVGLLNLIIFAFLLTFLAAIMASQMFRGDFPTADEAETVTRITFFNIYNSFIGMYQILSSENWTTIMYDATQFDARWDTAWLGALFFIMWFILANFIVLNMFIAVIQESFDVSEDEKRIHQVKAFLRQKGMVGASQGNLSLSSMFHFGRNHKDPLEFGSATMEQLLKDAVVDEFLDEPGKAPQHHMPIPMPQYPEVPIQPGVLSKAWGKIRGFSLGQDPNPFYSQIGLTKANEDLDPRTLAKQVVSATEMRRRAQRQYLQRHPKYNVSLFMFKPDNRLRKLCQWVVGPGRGGERIEGTSPWKPARVTFSALIYAAIVAMVLLACITTPLYQRQYYQTHSLSIRNWFVWTDMGFAILFSIEAIIKVIADGFFFTPNAYFRSTWGFIDGIVLITLWINVITSLYRDNNIARAVGAFKALRALRLLNVSDSARDTFHAVIIIGGWKVVSAAFVSLSLLIPFAILGLNLFNGQFENCNDTHSFSNLSNCVGEYESSPFQWNVLAPRQVANPYYSFDDFGSSIFILFQIVSQEGWTDTMWSAMSMTGNGILPRSFASQGNAVFFIIFNLLGAIFILTLFVSVFMRNYTEQTGVAFLTAEQRSWLELRKLLKQITPSKRSLSDGSRNWRRWCYKRATQKHGKWQRFLTVLLIFHLILLCVEFYPSVVWWDLLREYIFLVLTCIYIVNIIIRIVGLSWKRFRRSSWDVFSVPVVGGTFVTTLMSLSDNSDPTFDQLHKLFLVSIAFLLIPRNNQLDQLFKTAAASLQQIGNLLATWFVLFLVYAIAFTQTFGLTRFGSNENGNLNFRDVPKALILLFRMSCGEGWNAIMEDFATIEPPYCVKNDNFFQSDCGSGAWARALFISWNIISMYIFVSLFVSLIFESFSYVYQRSSGLAVVSREEIRRFKQAWSEFDPKGTGYISKEAFPRLLGELSGVFQMRIYDGDFTVRNLLEDCQVHQGHSGNAVPMSKRVVEGIDLDKLNERLKMIDVHKIRQRRERMNIFYEEMLVSAEPGRGIPFTSCLMILAHYNVITDTKSLRLEEFLRRRARLQRVHDTIQLNIVRGFLDTMHWSRWFRRTINARKDSRLEEPPQIPEIYVENPDDSLDSSNSTQPHDFTESTPLYPTPLDTSTSGPSGFRGRGLPPLDTSLQRRDSSKSLSSAGRDRSPGANPSPTQLSPNRLQAVDTSYPGAGRSSPTTPPLGRGGHSRQGSAVSNLSAQGVMESFDNSAWGESMRRSFTMRRPSRGAGERR